MATIVPEQDHAAQIQQHWKTSLIGGQVRYFDPIAGLWLSLDEAVTNAKARAAYRSVMGDHRECAAQDRYERSRGL